MYHLKFAVASVRGKLLHRGTSFTEGLEIHGFVDIVFASCLIFYCFFFVCLPFFKHFLGTRLVAYLLHKITVAAGERGKQATGLDR